MKTKRIDLRASETVNDKFETNAKILGHTRSSLLVVLMEAVNRHMEETGSLTFPVTFQGTNPKKELASNAHAAVRAAKAGVNSKAQKKTA
jgi:hypothetical protein